MRRFAPLALLMLGLLVILPAAAQDGTYYILQAARVRSCASTQCATLGTLRAGTEIEVLDTIDGQRVSGSIDWRHITYKGKDGYVHSSLTTDEEPEATISTSANVSTAPITTTPGLQSIPTNQPPLATAAPAVQSNMCNARDDLNCSNFSSRADANAHLQMCGDEDGLDSDNDGQACESLR